MFKQIFTTAAKNKLYEECRHTNELANIFGYIVYRFGFRHTSV